MGRRREAGELDREQGSASGESGCTAEWLGSGRHGALRGRTRMSLNKRQMETMIA